MRYYHSFLQTVVDGVDLVGIGDIHVEIVVVVLQDHALVQGDDCLVAGNTVLDGEGEGVVVHDAVVVVDLASVTPVCVLVKIGLLTWVEFVSWLVRYLVIL